MQKAMVKKCGNLIEFPKVNYAISNGLSQTVACKDFDIKQIISISTKKTATAQKRGMHHGTN